MCMDRSRYEPKWQGPSYTLIAALGHMYNHRIFTDVTIQTSKEGVSMCFAAHKLILALRSPTFADMFYNKSQRSNIIALEDISPRAFDILLRYIYSDSLECDNIDELIESFQVSQRFEIHSFFDTCIKRILEFSSDIFSYNVCAALKIANFTKSEELRGKCYVIIEKEPENVFLSKDFLTSDRDTVIFTLKETNLQVSPKVVLRRILRWMQHNNESDRNILACIDFSDFNIDEFLSIIEDFSNIFTGKEIRCIALNLMQPESSELPVWCKFTTTKCVTRKLSLYEDVEIIKERAMHVKTYCNRKFGKSLFYSQDGFCHEMLLKITISDSSSRLVMLELAFGSEFVPSNNLVIDLLCNFTKGKKMQPLKYILIPCRRHYYILFDCQQMSRADSSINIVLKVQATGLRLWKLDGPVSNFAFKVASVYNYDKTNTISTCCSRKFQTVQIKPFEDFLVFVDPKEGERKYIITSLFIDSLENFQKYKKSLSL